MELILAIVIVAILVLPFYQDKKMNDKFDEFEREYNKQYNKIKDKFYDDIDKLKEGFEEILNDRVQKIEQIHVKNSTYDNFDFFNNSFNKAKVIEEINVRFIKFFESSMLPKAKITIGNTDLTIYHINWHVIGVDNLYFDYLIGKEVIVKDDTICLMDEYKIKDNNESKQ